MNKVINFNNVCLSYHSNSFRSSSLSSVLARSWRSILGSSIDLPKDIQALSNLTVSISDGERVGLLGHNGAGKTTFLKAVAGLYPIVSGEIQVHGKVRSLFDLSLGFEPDATGRENILYRGLLMGLSPQEMKLLEEEIVEFADLGEFIDYPIKTYSAGMQVRLAFAVSTAVDGDILLLDEVVGVGDASFINKAIARLRNLMESANIVLLASHDLNTVREICTRCIVFERGRMIFDGQVEEAIEAYLQKQGERM